MSRPEYRMYYDFRCKTIEYMISRYLEDILRYSLFKKVAYLTSLHEVKLENDYIKINHHANYDYINNIYDEQEIIIDKLTRDLGILEERIVKNKVYINFTIHKVTIWIKIDKDFIGSLIGYLRLKGYEDETKY